MLTLVAHIQFLLLDDTATDEKEIFPMGHLKRISGSGWWCLHLQSCKFMVILLHSPTAGRLKPWGNWCVLGQCPGGHLLKDACASILSCPASVHNLILLGNAANSHYFSSQDKKTNGCILHAAQGTRTPSLSQLTFCTCNYDNSIGTSCHGA